MRKKITKPSKETGWDWKIEIFDGENKISENLYPSCLTSTEIIKKSDEILRKAENGKRNTHC